MGGCGSGRQLQSPSTGFIEIPEFTPRTIIPDTLELAGGSMINPGSDIEWNCRLKNISGRVLTFEVRIHFFDESFETEYEKYPVIRTVRMGPGIVIDVKGRIDFTGLPQAKLIQRLGIGAKSRK